VGNHTFHHIRLNDLDAATIQDELVQTNQVIESLTRQPVRFFRPPGGRYSPTVLSEVRKLGLTMAFWTDDPGDFDNLGQGMLESRLLSHLRRGGIVLLHDNVLQTIQVLPTFLRLAQREGFRLGTMSNLTTGNLQTSR
jgi:peptidoglycan/xylan/chitin deacetylase (PgdA/CDA1 family)